MIVVLFSDCVSLLSLPLVGVVAGRFWSFLVIGIVVVIVVIVVVSLFLVPCRCVSRMISGHCSCRCALLALFVSLLLLVVALCPFCFLFFSIDLLSACAHICRLTPLVLIVASSVVLAFYPVALAIFLSIVGSLVRVLSPVHVSLPVTCAVVVLFESGCNILA